MTSTRIISRRRIALLSLVTVAVVAAAGIYAALAFQDARESQAAPAAVEVTRSEALPAAPYVVFRNTASGQGFGEAATVPLKDPGGQRALSGKSCDRVYGTDKLTFCLQTKHELATIFQASVFDAGWKETASWPLAGIPSRARTNANGTLVATTVFVSGHAYSGAGFSTETVIRDQAGAGTGTMEDYALILDGNRIKATDRNIWGVTFVPGQPDVFYATASSQGKDLAGPGKHRRPDAHRCPQRGRVPLNIPGRHAPRLQEERHRHPDRAPQHRRPGPCQRHRIRPGRAAEHR